MKITIEPLEFPLCVKERITKIPKISKLHLEFVSEKNIYFDKTNLSIKEPLMLFLNDMLDYYLLIDNNYKSFFNEDLTIEIKRYEKILKDLNTKLKRIKNAYIDSIIEQDDFTEEEKSIKLQIEETKIKLNSLNSADENQNHKEDLKLYNNLFQLEKMKYKSYSVRKNGLWNKLTKEQKAELINKYIDSIEIEKKKDEIIIKKININKKEFKISVICLETIVLIW